MENESKKSSGFGDSAGSSEKPKSRQSRKKKPEFVVEVPSTPIVEPTPEPTPEPEPEPTPAPVAERKKPHRIFPSRYRR